MIVLGLLLVLLSAGGIFLVVTQAGPSYTAFGYTIAPTTQEMFLGGALAMALLVLGLWMMSSGSVRSVRRRRALREARVHQRHAQPTTDRLVAGGSDDSH